MRLMSTIPGSAAPSLRQCSAADHLGRSEIVRHPRPEDARCRSSPRWTATASITGARAVARGTRGHGAGAARVSRSGARCCCTTIPSGRLEPSVADLNVAARLHDGGVGFGIINNDATELYVVVEVPRDRPVLRIDPFDVVDTLGEGGPVAARLGAVRGPAEPARHGRATSPTATTTAACSCSRRAPASGSRSPIWCPRSPGPGPTASARS